jgi:hypothetical protein
MLKQLQYKCNVQKDKINSSSSIVMKENLTDKMKERWKMKDAPKGSFKRKIAIRNICSVHSTHVRIRSKVFILRFLFAIMNRFCISWHYHHILYYFFAISLLALLSPKNLNIREKIWIFKKICSVVVKHSLQHMLPLYVHPPMHKIKMDIKKRNGSETKRKC